MTYTVELVMSSGRHVPLPALRIDPRTGSTGQTIPIDVHLVSSVRLIAPTPADVLDARLPHAESGDLR